MASSCGLQTGNMKSAISFLAARPGEGPWQKRIARSERSRTRTTGESGEATSTCEARGRAWRRRRGDSRDGGEEDDRWGREGAAGVRGVHRRCSARKP